MKMMMNRQSTQFKQEIIQRLARPCIKSLNWSKQSEAIDENDDSAVGCPANNCAQLVKARRSMEMMMENKF